jgi:hypothetical protein
MVANMLPSAPLAVEKLALPYRAHFSQGGSKVVSSEVRSTHGPRLGKLEMRFQTTVTVSTRAASLRSLRRRTINFRWELD